MCAPAHGRWAGLARIRPNKKVEKELNDKEAAVYPKRQDPVDPVDAFNDKAREVMTDDGLSWLQLKQ